MLFERLRFDFTHFKAVKPSELELIEDKVNQVVLENRPVQWTVTDFDTAKSKGAMALFGEKYGEEVRMVEVPGYSIELCGGTHVQSTGEIGPFVIVSESAIAAGMRRIEALTGNNALKYLKTKRDVTDSVAQLLKVSSEKLIERVMNLAASEKRLTRELSEIKKKAEVESAKGKLQSSGKKIKSVTLIIEAVAGRDAALTYTDQIKKSDQPTIVGLINKKNYFLAASPGAIKIGLDAQKAIKHINEKFSGRGGGKPHFAQGGAKDEIDRQVFEQELEDFISKSVD